MKKKTLKLNRLKKLVKHLKSGKLGHVAFSFKYYVLKLTKDRETGENLCGTVGCAIGEMPFVWPKRFQFVGSDVMDKNNPAIATYKMAELFFGIDKDEFHSLFMPDTFEYIQRYVPGNFGEDAKLEDVIANIEAFIELKEKELV